MSRLRESEYIADMTTKLINRVWRWDWRESLNAIPPFYLVGDKQDYGRPIYAVPTDFSGLRKANLVRVVDSANSTQRLAPQSVPMRCVARQNPQRIYGIPNILSFEPSEAVFRVFPILSPTINTNEYFVEGVYKKLPQSNLYDTSTVIGAPILASEITGANYSNTLLPLDDRWYDLLSDVAVQIARKQEVNATDALKIDSYIDSLLAGAAREEGVEIGGALVHPSEALSESGSGWVGGPLGYLGY